MSFTKHVTLNVDNIWYNNKVGIQHRTTLCIINQVHAWSTAMMSLQHSTHPNVMQCNCYNALSSIGMYHICVHIRHISHITWCHIDTMPLHFSTWFSYKLLQCPIISQHQRLLSQSTTICPYISMTRYRSRVYYNNIYNNNIKYNNGCTGDFLRIVYIK